MAKLKDKTPENISKEDKNYLDKNAEKLSDSTQYARWIGSPDDHADHDGQSLVTRNHEVIKNGLKRATPNPLRCLAQNMETASGYCDLTSQATAATDWMRLVGTIGLRRLTSATWFSYIRKS